MAQKVQKKYSLKLQGVVSIEDGHIIVSVEDRGDFDLATLMDAFDGNECSISVSYDEEYTSPEVDDETGEVI